jgi:hypothetical protein
VVRENWETRSACPLGFLTVLLWRRLSSTGKLLQP